MPTWGMGALPRPGRAPPTSGFASRTLFIFNAFQHPSSPKMHQWRPPLRHPEALAPEPEALTPDSEDSEFEIGFAELRPK